MLTKQLRSELQRSPLISVLFAGSMEHLMRDLFGPTRRALSQFGNFHELTPISPHEWEAGIAARYSGTPSSGARRALSMMERAGIAERHGRGDWVIPGPSYEATSPPALDVWHPARLTHAGRRLCGAGCFCRILRRSISCGPCAWNGAWSTIPNLRRSWSKTTSGRFSLMCPWMRRVRRLDGH